MIRTVFEKELEKLHIDLMRMGALIEQAIANSIEAFRDNNQALAKDIIENDRAVNDMEKAIEARALSLMLKQQPVARDLRNISTALKVVTDMERIGDQSADIAELVLRIRELPNCDSVTHILEMAEIAKGMVNRSITAFTGADVEIAGAVIAEDDQVDELFNKIKEDIVRMLKAESKSTDTCVDLLMIAKYLERIGDHAVNICEWTQFSKTGTLKNTKLL